MVQLDVSAQQTFFEKELLNNTQDIIKSRQFSLIQSIMILFFTTLTTLSFVPIIIVLVRLHKRRGQDIVLTVVAALSFFVYRTSVGFNAPDFFLEGDSWHKLQQIFLLIEYCSLIIYLANVPPKWQGYCLATGISIIVIF